MASDELYVKIDGEIHGPLPREDAAELIACAPPDAQIFITTSLGSAWVPPTEVPGLVNRFSFQNFQNSTNASLSLRFDPPVSEVRTETPPRPPEFTSLLSEESHWEDSIPSLNIPYSDHPPEKAPRELGDNQPDTPAPSGGPPSLTSVKIDFRNLSSAGVKQTPSSPFRQPAGPAPEGARPATARPVQRARPSVRATPSYLPKLRACPIVMAGGGRRILATFADAALLTAAVSLLGLKLTNVVGFAVLFLFINVTNLALLFLRGQTIGKWAAGIAIVDVAEPTVVPFFRILFLHYILWFVAYAVSFIGLSSNPSPGLGAIIALFGFGVLATDILPVFSTEKRRLSERIAGTRVIRVPQGFERTGDRYVELGPPAAPPVPTPVLLALVVATMILGQKPVTDFQRRMLAASANPRKAKDTAALNKIAPPYGPLNATVHVLEFGDFAQAASREQYPRTKALLIRYENNVKYTFHAVSWDSSADSTGLLAAKALVCATEQGKRYAMKDWLFRYSANLNETTLARIAGILHLNRNQFKNCLAHESTLASVRYVTSTAGSLGVTQVPAFFVNNEPVVATSDTDLHTALERRIAEEFPRTPPAAPQ